VIETRFVEIGLDDENRLGIDWNAVASATGAAVPHTFPFGDSSLGSYGPSVTGGGGNGVFPPAPATVTSSTAQGLFTFGSLDFSAFSALLEMIERESRVEVVSNPRLVVNDRNTATILVGERYPILSAKVSEFGTITEELDHYEPVGVQLVVTPAILDDDQIQLSVRPSSSSLGPVVEGSSGIQVARINSRQIDTSVTVKDGQTVVLGGLITTREARTHSSVPFLGAVPLLGRLFQHTAVKTERVDLVVFLTVRIVREAGLTESQRKLFERSLEAGEGLGAVRPRRALEYALASPQY
jgi:type II secretory pathway component GspD/PulD (secretin)